MTVPQSPSDDLVDRVYDIAVAPERFEEFIDAWSGLRTPSGDPEDYGVLTSPPVFKHIERAERVLGELVSTKAKARDSAQEWAEALAAAALVVNPAGDVLAVNSNAASVLSIGIGHKLRDLPFERHDITHLAEAVAATSSHDHPTARLMRLRFEKDSAPVLLRIFEGAGGEQGQIGLIVSTLAWPEKLAKPLMQAFRLTQAELDVLKDLSIGYSVKEIAKRSGRLEPTIRTHIRALLEKTETRSQMELLRMTLRLFDVIEPRPRISPLQAPMAGALNDQNSYQRLVLSDGRKLDYLVTGCLCGLPFVMLPTDMGFTRLPGKAEHWLYQNGMRMIVPVRAGYGYSSPLPKGADAFSIATADTLELLQALGISRCPILAFCDDFHLAVLMAGAAPDRFNAIIGVGPAMPASTPQHFKRMPKWTRFIYANARYAPKALSYLSMAFTQYIRSVGPQRFFQAIMATSPPDLTVIADEEIFTALSRGSEIAIGPRFTAHTAWAAGALCNYGVDWSGALARCPVPMILFAGGQDPFNPFETTEEYAASTPAITLHAFPDYGQFLYPLWPRFLREVQRHLDS